MSMCSEDGRLNNFQETTYQQDKINDSIINIESSAQKKQKQITNIYKQQIPRSNN